MVGESIYAPRDVKYNTPLDLFENVGPDLLVTEKTLPESARYIDNLLRMIGLRALESVNS